MKSVNPHEKQIKIDGLNINYKEIGNGGIPIVLLHGWGIDSDRYVELANLIINYEKIDKDISEDNKESQKSSTQENGANENGDNSQEGSTGLSPQWSQRKNGPNEDFPPQSQTPQPPLSGGTNLTYKIIVPDLPGLGKSDEPNEDWDLDDYVEFTDKFIKNVTQARGFELIKNILKQIKPNFTNFKELYTKQKHSRQDNDSNYQDDSVNQIKILNQVQNDKADEKNKKIVLIGHSFGGRISIKYAEKYPEKIEKMVLTGAAGIKHSLSKKQRIFFILAKTGKTIFSLPVINKFQKYAEKFLYIIVRERDYQKASPRMKEIMKNVLAEDLTPVLEKIKISTLLVWGKLDNSTPLSDGMIMNEKIENSQLIIFDDANHSLPYQKAEEFAKVIKEFIC